jgi:DnaJ-class molecular chaperone
MSKLNFYERLGVPKDASETDIKKSYRKLSLEFHPDRNPDEIEKYKEINEAYETLGDSSRRSEYDMSLRFGGGGMGGSGGVHPFFQNEMQGFPDLGNLFNMMFMHGGGSGCGFPGMDDPFTQMHEMPGIRIFHTTRGNGINIRELFKQVPEQLTTNVEITLEQSYNGGELEIQVERFLILNNIKSTEIEMLSIHIPQGIHENEEFLVKDKGNAINGNYSDLCIVFSIKPHFSFIKKDMDLIFKKNISLKDALCGGSFELKHLNGKILNINNSNRSIIKPNFKKTIPGLGMIKNNVIGNLVIEFYIDFPDELSAEQIEVLSKIL